jgi:hypothetical protein
MKNVNNWKSLKQHHMTRGLLWIAIMNFELLALSNIDFGFFPPYVMAQILLRIFALGSFSFAN